MNIDSLPYKTFKKLKRKYAVKTLFISERDFNNPLFQRAFKDIPSFLKHLFSKEGVEITRLAHDYKSLDGPNPKLGVVMLANDSVVTPGVEAHVLIDHNARYLEVAATELPK